MNPLLKDIFDECRQIVEIATEKNLTLATAESCTGGLIGGAITAIPGSSKIFKGGITAYDNQIKTELLGIPPSTLGKYGAVSEKVAERMAAGAVERLGVDIAVSVTGIAGPGGGSEEKPVGTVWIGLAVKTGDKVSTEATHFAYGDIGRNRVRDMTCYDALKVLKAGLKG